MVEILAQRLTYISTVAVLWYNHTGWPGVKHQFTYLLPLLWYYCENERERECVYVHELKVKKAAAALAQAMSDRS